MDARMRLSDNFYLDEFTQSEAAERHGITIIVEPGSEIERNIQRLVDTVLQPLRNALGPVTITSGYRPPRVNGLIGGSPTSQHKYGLASDIVVHGYTPLQVAKWIRDNIDDYDQLIHEFGRWVHVSVPADNAAPRNECLTAAKVNGRTGYVPGLIAVEDAERVVA